MPLSWNEIKDRALRFSREWQQESSEDAEAKSFWDGFFDVFGITRRRVASFEQPVTKADGRGGYIDLLWKGILLVEHKSRGKDLDRAFKQATDYFPGLKERDLPRYVLVSDFARFRLFDLDSGEQHEFTLEDLHRNVARFGFIAGYQVRTFTEQDPANIKAAERMGALHDVLKASGYEGHALEVLLVRLLFCLFAEDTGIFERRQFQDFIENRTDEDGSDLGARLAELFHALNTPRAKRQKTLDEAVAAFEYVNGKLFAEPLPPAAFDRAQRNALLDACALDWSRISPAIFGSMFQSVMDAKARRNLGAHYTSEKNILKLIGPLFLDELKAELERIGSHEGKLKSFHVKLAGLRFLDPACGCGNFLVIAYRELRLLEIEVLQRLYARQASVLRGVADHVAVDVDQFYGIEIEEFPAQIAQVALWLMDHQMNLRVAERFGEYFARLPLVKSATIVHGNALRIDWNDVVAAKGLSYILGNPPFVGKKEQGAAQKSDMARVFSGVKGGGVLDFVAAWYLLAAKYVHDTTIRCAYVSTNSITQGEQVGVLWSELYRLGMHIQFAHRTFKWSNEARGKAAVHCVIVGFGPTTIAAPRLFDYARPDDDPIEQTVKEINPYLVDAAPILLEKRMKPISKSPEMDFGSKAADFGHLTLSEIERSQLVEEFPGSEKYVREFIGSEEFLNGTKRYCLWLKGADASEIRFIPPIVRRLEQVRTERAKSVDANTRRWADTPSLFQADRQPTDRYLVVPKVSSERRRYVPLGFCEPDLIVNPSVLVVPHARLYDFGLLQSSMHMTWMRYTCGRLESRYQYSNTIVYNNFPWPELPSDQHCATIETAAQGVLDARALFVDATLADLYDPVTMPPPLVKAHQQLDRAVDAAYVAAEKAAGRKLPKLATDAERVSFLFERYQALTSMLPATKSPRTAKKKKVRQ